MPTNTPTTSPAHLQLAPGLRGQSWDNWTVFYGWNLVIPYGDAKGRTQLEILGPARAGLMDRLRDPHGYSNRHVVTHRDNLYLRTSPTRAANASETLHVIAEREGVTCLGLLRKFHRLVMEGPKAIEQPEQVQPAAHGRCLLPPAWVETGFTLGEPRWHVKEYRATLELFWEKRIVGTVSWSETEPTRVSPNGDVYLTDPHRCFLSEALAIVIKELARQTLPELSMGELEHQLCAVVEDTRRRRAERASRRGTNPPTEPAANGGKTLLSRLSLAVSAQDDRAAATLAAQHPEAKREIWEKMLPTVFAAGLVETARILTPRVGRVFLDDLALCRSALQMRSAELLTLAVALETPHEDHADERTRLFFDTLVACGDAALIIAATDGLRPPVHTPGERDEFLTAAWARALAARNWPLCESIAARGGIEPMDVVSRVTKKWSQAGPKHVLEALASGRDVPRLFGKQDTLCPAQLECLLLAVPEADGKVPVDALLEYSARFENHASRLNNLSAGVARWYVSGGDMKVRSLLTALFRAGASWKEIPSEAFSSWQSLLLKKAGERCEVNLERLREHLRRIGASDAAKRLQGLSRVRAQREARSARNWY